MYDLFTAMSGAVAQERKLDVISNNLANLSTAGFRKEDLSIAAAEPRFRFAELWEQQLSAAQELRRPEPPLGIRLAAPAEQRLNLTPGALVKTDHPLDAALSETRPELKGRAFFAVQGPDGELLARDGKFALAEDNGVSRLVHQASGLPVLNAGGSTIDLPAANVEILADGRILAAGAEVARLRVVTFDAAEAVTRRGAGLYALQNGAAAIAELDAGDYQIRQGYLEQANVNAVEELVRMIRVQRSYEAMLKSMQTADESYSRLIAMALQG